MFLFSDYYVHANDSNKTTISFFTDIIVPKILSNFFLLNCVLFAFLYIYLSKSLIQNWIGYVTAHSKSKYSIKRSRKIIFFFAYTKFNHFYLLTIFKNFVSLNFYVERNGNLIGTRIFFFLNKI